MSKLIKRGDEARKALEAGVNSLADTAVSYTHLTLPTIRLV